MESIDQLDGHLERLTADIRALAVCQPIDQKLHQQLVNEASTIAAHVAALLAQQEALVGIKVDPASDRSALLARIEELTRLADLREKTRLRYQDLSAQLKAGTIVHRSHLLLRSLNQLREQAAREVQGLCDALPPAVLPGPESPLAWIDWVLALQEPDLSTYLQQVEQMAPALARFSIEMDASWWRPAPHPQDVPHEPDAAPATEIEPPPSGPPTPASAIAPAPEPPLPTEPGPTAASELLPAPPAPEPIAASELVAPAHPSAPAPAPAPEPPLPDKDSAAASPPIDLEPGEDMASSSPPTRLPSSLTPRPDEVLAALEIDSEPPQPAPQNDLSFVDYREQNWLAPSGRCAPAPWRDQDFGRSLQRAMAQALEDRHLASLLLFARAAEQLCHPALIGSADLEVIGDLMTQPDLVETRHRSDPLSQARARSTQMNTPAARVQVFLDAICGTGEDRIAPDDIDLILEFAGYTCPLLHSTVSALLRLAALGVSPLRPLRERLRAGPEPPAVSLDELTAILDRERQQLHADCHPLFSAAGGRIQQTFSRNAWSRFIERVWPTITQLFPVARKGVQSWDPSLVRAQIESIVPTASQIANHAGVQFQDRHTFDRFAKRIAASAARVNEAMARLVEARSPRRATSPIDDQFPLDDLRALLGSPPLTVPEEELCRSLLAQLLQPDEQEAPDPLAFTLAEICARPDLLAVLDEIDEDALRRAQPARPLARVTGVRDPLRAAAILMEPGAVGITDDQPSFEALRQHLWAQQRGDLLGRVIALLPASDQSRLHRERADLQEQLHQALAAVRRPWQTLEELAQPAAGPLGTRCAEAERHIEEVAENHAGSLLLLSWLGALRDRAERARADAVRELARTTHESNHPRRREVLAALRDGRAADAMMLLGEGPVERQETLRETAWRRAARARFPHPLAALLEAKGDPLDPLIEAWLRGVTGQAQMSDWGLRSRFAQLIFGPKGRDKKSLHDQGDNTATEYAMRCQHLREWLQPLNPCYLPQLSKFHRVLLLTPPVRVSDAGFVQHTAELVRRKPHDLCVLLCPLLGPQIREELSRELRRHATTAVVIDDLDLCRLLNPGGQRPNQVIGLLEIAFEQLPWRGLSPFSLHDGQHVQMEIYVGRRRDAMQLSFSDEYTRLFSGRKLGKSALLSVIEKRDDKIPLPSGCRLRVLYVPIAGVDSEHAIVTEIRRKMLDHLGYFPGEIDPRMLAERPGEALVEAMQIFVRERPTESLLVILDEADVFVESQLRAYEEESERCLSFLIRTRIQAAKDRMGLPRVRFLFSGYRATNSDGGAWANWGKVLRLSPLEPHEAAALIQGPLARLGIDASQQAQAIAFRCGYQPAVLLCFGEQLLEHLERSRPPALRDHVDVTSEDVAVVFNTAQVQDEIRTVVRNNFQGNRLGYNVFYTLLEEFARVPPCSGLADAAERVVRHLQRIDEDLEWLHRGQGSAVDEVEGHLRDFAHRRLLEVRHEPGANAPVYHLKFPHHLAVVRQSNYEAQIRMNIESLREGAPTGDALHRGRRDRHTAIRAMVPDVQLSRLMDAIRTPPSTDMPLRAAVAVSLWAEAIQHRSRGVPDRLGIHAAWTTRADDPQLGRHLREDDLVAVLDTGEDAIDRVLEQRPAERPPPLLLGGADLLRACLRRERERDEFFEICSVGRLSRQMVAWWFERVRCLELPGAGALQRVYEWSGGIPYLLGELDRLLLQEGGSEGGFSLSAQKFDAVLERAEEQMPLAAAHLADGRAAQRLAPREMQILYMVATVCRENHYDEARLRGALLPDLMENWPLYLEHCPVPAEPLSQADWVSLSVVQHIGFLPVDPLRPPGLPFDRMVPLAERDAVLRLLGLGPR